jgi:hypothetical protein
MYTKLVNKPQGIVVSEIHIYDDCNYDYTGRTFVINDGPTESDEFSTYSERSEIDALEAYADKVWGDYHGFEITGKFHGYFVK